MKKILALILAMVMLLSMMACTAQKVDPSETQPSQQTATAKEEAPVAEAQPEEAGILTALDKPVEIEFWHTYTDTHLELLQKLTDEFNASQDKVKVELIFQANDEYETKIMASAKSKTLPNIIRGQAVYITQYVDSGIVADITPYIYDETVGFANFDEDVIPGLAELCSQWDGKYYALPLAMTCNVFFYNADMFAELNLTPPQTWEELEPVVAAVSEHIGKPGFGFQIMPDAYMELLMHAGAGVVSDGKSSFASAESIEVANWFKDLCDKGIARLVGEDRHFTNPIANGDVGCFVGLSGNLPYLSAAIGDKFTLGAAPLPTFEGGENFAALSEPVFSVVKSTPEEELASWMYLSYLLESQRNAEWAVTFGGIPLTYSAMNTDVYQNYVETNVVAKAVSAQADALGFIPAVNGFYDVKSALSKSLEEIFLGMKDVETALGEAAAAAEEAMAG